MPEITNSCVAGGLFGISQKVEFAFCNDSSIFYDAGEDTDISSFEGGYDYNVDETTVAGNPRVQSQVTSFKEEYEVTFKENGKVSAFRAQLLYLKNILSDSDWLGFVNGGLIIRKTVRFKGGNSVTIWENVVFQEKGLDDLVEENKNEWSLTFQANKKPRTFHTTLINSVPARYANELKDSKFANAPTTTVAGTSITFNFSGNFVVKDTQGYITNVYELVKINNETGAQTVLLSTLSTTTPKLTYSAPNLSGFTSQTIQKGETIVLFGYRGTNAKVQLWAYENL